MNTLLTWTGKGGAEGHAGGIHLFTVAWDSSKRYPGQPWVMQCKLPGVYEQLRGAEREDLHVQAEEILAAWLARVTGGAS